MLRVSVVFIQPPSSTGIESKREVRYFSIIKPTRYTNFTNLFWHETLHVSDSSSVHHQEFIHRKLSNGICHTGLSSCRAGPGWMDASSWFYYKEICYDARSHERKIRGKFHLHPSVKCGFHYTEFHETHKRATGCCGGILYQISPRSV